MSSYIDDIAKLIGYDWHQDKLDTNQSYRKKHTGIDTNINKNLSGLEQKLSQVEPETGQTLAKILFDKGDPMWYWALTNLPEDAIKRIKDKSGIK